VLVAINREFDFESDRYVTGRAPQGLIVSLLSPAYKLTGATTFQYFKIYQFAFVPEGFQEYGCGRSYAG
jgi:hypothetical protein